MSNSLTVPFESSLTSPDRLNDNFSHSSATRRLIESPMRWPIRNQILLPFAILQAVAVGVITISAAWIAVDRAERDAIARLDQVVATLSSSRFPIQGAVLEQMKGLSGAELIASNDSGTITATTLPLEASQTILVSAQSVSAGAGRLGDFQPVSAGDETWLVGAVSVLRSPELKQLLVLVPEQQWQAVRRDVIVPPLVIGGITVLVMGLLSWFIAARLGTRLDRMQRHVGRLATMQFDNLLPVTGDDELTRLATSINRMAQELQQATQQIRVTERTTLITQVAGGLAHQLRNSITGARMAVQLHLRRTNNVDSESLLVAIRQLSLTENQIRGLLSLTKDAQQTPVEGRIDEALATIQSLLTPQFEHSESRFSIELPPQEQRTLLVAADGEQTQVALLNLIQNGLEACRPGGQVMVVVSLLSVLIQVDVLDSGPGVSDALSGKVFDPFVTGKPEGVGLGLTLAAQVAELHGGSLKYDRITGWTRFRFQLRRIR